MDTVVEKLSPPSGGSRETARRLPPRTPQHPYFQTPIGLKSKTALITKRSRKKGPQLLPEERIIDDARGWTGRLGVHSKHQLHLVRVGWLATESAHLTCPCCSEDVVLRYVSGYWLNLSPQNSEHIPDQGRNPRAPNCRSWDMLAVFGSMVPKKVAMHSPGNPGKRRYRVDMLVHTWNGSPRYVSTFFVDFSLDTLAAVSIGYDKCPILETC